MLLTLRGFDSVADFWRRSSCACRHERRKKIIDWCIASQLHTFLTLDYLLSVRSVAMNTIIRIEFPPKTQPAELVNLVFKSTDFLVMKMLKCYLQTMTLNRFHNAPDNCTSQFASPLHLSPFQTSPSRISPSSHANHTTLSTSHSVSTLQQIYTHLTPTPSQHQT